MIVAVLNLVYPNLYLMIVGIWPDIAEAFSKPEEAIRNAEFFQEKRRDLVAKYGIQLKAEF